MYRRSAATDDPHIGLKDLYTSTAEGSVLYSARSIGGSYSTALINHNGADVYIRLSTSHQPVGIESRYSFC